MKKLYVFENPLCTVSDRWHSGGGIVIVTGADNNPSDVWRISPQRETNDDGELGDPDYVYDVPDSSPDAVIVFPDAGCC